MMNKSKGRDQLLAETVHEDWAEGCGAAFARQAAALARRRRFVRRAALGIASAAGAILLASGLLFRPAPTPPVASPYAAPPAYEVISDEQLLAQLKDQPLLVLPDENGTRKFVLLDRPADGS